MSFQMTICSVTVKVGVLGQCAHGSHFRPRISMVSFISLPIDHSYHVHCCHDCLDQIAERSVMTKKSKTKQTTQSQNPCFTFACSSSGSLPFCMETHNTHLYPFFLWRISLSLSVLPPSFFFNSPPPLFSGKAGLLAAYFLYFCPRTFLCH